MPGFAQEKDMPIWNIQASKKAKNTYLLSYKVQLQKGWHIYSQKAGKGPVSTKVVIQKNPLLQVSGEVQEKGRLISHFEKAFNAVLNYYEDSLILEQNVRLRAKAKTIINGYIEYMICNDSKCLPPRKEKIALTLQGE